MGTTATTPGNHLRIGAGAVAPSDFGLAVDVTAMTNEVMSRIGFDTAAGEVEFVTLSERSLAFIDCVRVGS
jgi:hypothetical protein